MTDQPRGSAAYEPCHRAGHSHDWRDCPTPNVAETTCPTRTPEPHLLGEFPMTCYACHVEADS